MHYAIEEHQHRFAAWAASLAASQKGQRFKVKSGVGWLESAGLDWKKLVDWKSLPEARNFDQWHEKTCDDLVSKANNAIGYGVAAKLLNVYLKSRFVCGPWADEAKVKAIHPPIDSELLKAIASKYPGLKYLEKPVWTKKNKREYKITIEELRNLALDEPFWKVEAYWPGFQHTK